MELKEKVVLITGATGGLGRSMAGLFVEKGARLLLTDVADDSLKELARELGESVLGAFTADLTDTRGCWAVHKKCGKFAQRVDVLVNNAGIAHIGSFASIPSDKWEMLMQLNLLAPMRLTHLFLPDMLAAGSGHIVNISSAAGLVGAGFMGPYSASKFGLRGFSEALHTDVSEKGVGVTVAYPFFTRTRILESEQFGRDDADKLSVPDWLIGQTADVAREIVEGVENDTLHVYPGLVSRGIDIMNRISPWLTQFIQKNLV